MRSTASESVPRMWFRETPHGLLPYRTAGGKGVHVLVVERALGHPLPVGAVVHHVNGVRDDNRNENLVACQDQSYHKLLHRRAEALRECGHADWRRCALCHTWDSVENLRRKSRYDVAHRVCLNAKGRARYAQAKLGEGADPVKLWEWVKERALAAPSDR